MHLQLRLTQSCSSFRYPSSHITPPSYQVRPNRFCLSLTEEDDNGTLEHTGGGSAGEWAEGKGVSATTSVR